MDSSEWVECRGVGQVSCSEVKMGTRDQVTNAQCIEQRCLDSVISSYWKLSSTAVTWSDFHPKTTPFPTVDDDLWGALGIQMTSLKVVKRE